VDSEKESGKNGKETREAPCDRRKLKKKKKKERQGLQDANLDMSS